MRFDRLRLTGFKSFVDPAELVIREGLTGIVGPNGCGKSNLLEALRWVMGETSAKSLRGGGMEDVIFAGTATRPALDFAEVSVLTELTGDETEVVRRIERGAGSAYRIDGKDVRAKDVSLLFADAATGAHSPALVSQGRIGAVIAAKPADRRQMLEEAAGIAGLHVRRRDAEQKLRATEANLARLDEVITDQNLRAATLRRQAKQAERYRELSTRIRVAEGRALFARWREAAALADAARAEAAAAEEKVLAAAEAQRATAAHAHAAAQALAGARAVANAARDAASEARHKLAGLTAERDRTVRRIAELADARARIAEDRAREGALASDAAAALARLAEEAKALETRIADDAARLPALAERQAGADAAVAEAEVALAQAQARQASELADARVAAAALATARERLARAERDAGRLAEEAAALGDSAAIDRERAAAVAARAEAAAAAEAARAALAEAEAAERDGRALRDTAEAARADAASRLAVADGEAKALSAATRPGPRERLLDRLKVAAGYERALAAALGDDLEAGLDAAAERHWAGAAPAAGDPGAPAGSSALAGHVEAPAVLARRLAQVFVGDDIGQPLAVGQRLVTRDGALRRWDGFVARPGASGAAERLERVNRLAALEAARPELAAAVDAAATERARIDQAIAEARAAAEAARRALVTADERAREAGRAEDRAAAAGERLVAQRAELDRRGTRLAEEHREAAAAVTAAEAAVAALPDAEVIGTRVTALRGEAMTLRDAAAAARAERAMLDQALDELRARQAAGSGEAKSWRARAGDAARRIADMDKRERELTGEADALAERPDALAAEIAALDADAAAARTAADTAQAAERDAEAALARTEAAARAASEALAEAREARAGAVARAESHDARRIEIGRAAGERFEAPAPALPDRLGFDHETVGSAEAEGAAHERLNAERERIGPVNLVAETELAELDAAAGTSAAERDELAEAVNRLRGAIGSLNREGRERLRAAFEAVDKHFRRLFTTLFAGGEAHLALVDSDDPLEAGLEIMAQPPGKKLQSLTLLSGGEQALTAIALVFALFLTNPAPICVLDEVDAPLDDANIERFCDLLDRMTTETATRYLIVTHNAVTMSRMDRLFGVTMVERGVSRLVSVDLGGAERLLAAE